MASGAKCDANGASAAAVAASSLEHVTGALSVAVEPLLRPPGADAYSEEQKRGCLAIALRLREPKLGDILEQLHRLVGKRSSSDPAAAAATVDVAMKALAVLLGVRAAVIDAEVLATRLAREQGWLRGHRLRALALLLQAPGVEADELLKLALRANPHGLLVAAVGVLVDAAVPRAEEATGGLEALKLAIALRLGRGRPPVELANGGGLRLFLALLRCEPATEAKVISSLTSWSSVARDAARRVLQGKVGDVSLQGLDVAAVTASRREPRERQLRTLAGLLGVKGVAREVSLLEALAKVAADLPGETVVALLNAILAPGDASAATDGVAPERVVDVLVHRIGASTRVLTSSELRLQAMACLFQTPPEREAVLHRVAQFRACGSLPPRTSRSVVECLLLGKPLTAAERARASEEEGLLNALGITAGPTTPEAIRLVADAQLLAEVCEPSRASEQAPLASARPKAPPPPPAVVGAVVGENSTTGASSTKGPLATAPKSAVSAMATAPKAGSKAGFGVGPGTGRFGLGALELEPFDDDEDEESSTEAAAPAAAPAAEATSGATGWSALAALVAEDEDEVAADEAAEAEDEEDGEEEDEDGDEVVDDEEDEEASDAAPEGGGKTANQKAAGSEAEIEDSDDEDYEGGVNSDDENISQTAGLSDFDKEDSYNGSDFSMDMDGEEDSEQSGSGEGIDLSQGLLTSMLSGGSLHAEEKRTSRDMLLGSRAHRQKPSIRVVFPTLIWRGKDMMVLNKPADWICSASDVDKKKGRPLDPNEKVANKGFKVLDDLLQYKFQEREKKYIHWWIQLMHDLDSESYPNLFDEDQNYGLCHRLDRETSGTVLVGLTQLARQQMRECFHRHYVRKLYVCLVHGVVEPHEQTIDRNLEALGQKARLHPNGKRARTHVTVVGYYSRKFKCGKVEEYSLCTCEIAEGRMHQIRLHMSGAIGAPIVSEFYYQKPKQMVEDRRWCERTFLHAYAVGFPDVSGSSRRIGIDKGDSTGMVEEERRDTEQEWHCCVCPLTVELREALRDLEPRDEEAGNLLKTLMESGLLSSSHSAVHCMGTTARKEEIDISFFPWSSVINPIEMGDLNKPREGPGNPSDTHPRKGKGKGKSKSDDRNKLKNGPENGRLRLSRPLRGSSASPKRRDGLPRKRMRPEGRGLTRGRSRSLGGSPVAPLRQRRLRSRSGGRPVRGRALLPGGLRRRGLSPGGGGLLRRSLSREGLRRKRRRLPSPASTSPARGAA